MNKQSVEVLGSWVTTIGTIVTAIGSTPMRSLKGDDKKKWEQASEQLDFGGNAFQGIGNMIEAFFSEKFNLEVAGEIIQASGNVTVLFSILTEDNEEKKININIVGNAQQAFGGFLEVIEDVGEIIKQGSGDPTSAIGNLLQSIGNSLQVIGGLYDLEILRARQEFGLDDDGDDETEIELAEESITNPIPEQIKQYGEISELLKYSGSWIQAGGSILTAVADERKLKRIQEQQKELQEKKKKRKKKKKRSSKEQTESKKKDTSKEYIEIKKKS